MEFEKLQGIKGGQSGCFCCGNQHEHLPMNSLIAVGFGDASVTKNGEVIYEEMAAEFKGKSLWVAQDAENEALKESDSDWRIHLVAPLSERHYQRQGDGLWVLYEKGPGFA